MHLVKSIAFNSKLLINYTRIIRRQSYSFVYLQSKTTDKYRNYREQEKVSRPQKSLDKTYWELLLPKIQEPARNLIQLILNPTSSKKQVMHGLKEYLQFRNYTFEPNLRTDVGCLAVLVALNHSSYIGAFQEYENRIVDFVTLADITYNPFDSFMLKFLLTSIHKRTAMNVQKNIRQYYRLKLVEIALENFERFENKDLIQIISIIEEALQKDKMNFITKWRFYPLVQAIQQRVITLMREYVETKQYEKQKETETIITAPFFYKLVHLTYFYNFIPEDHAKMFYKFLVKRDQLRREDYHFVTGILNAICLMPYVEIDVDSEVQNKENTKNDQKITFRKKLLNYFEQLYNKNSFYRRTWHQAHLQSKKYTIQRFFQDQFHSAFKSLPFENYDNKFVFLRQKDIIKPKIPEFVWRLFKDNQKILFEKIILNDVIKNIYPEKISIPRHQIPNLNKKPSVNADNEANLKIWEALDGLGYEYKKEQIVSQRQVDLVVDDNIIIEVDGEGHYIYFTKQVASDTSFRNLHLLLSGYKLVIISMYEYNMNRSTEQLKQLIKQKIQIVKQEGVVYVC